MNIASNPWTFANADIPAASTIAAGGITQVSPLTPGAVKVTTTGVHGRAVGDFLTIFGNSAGRFQGWYKVIAVIDTTHLLLANLSSPTSGRPFNTTLAADGGGTILVNQVQQNVRAEDISWQNATAGATLLILDRNGNTIWSASSALAESGSQNRGKIMWVDGVTLETLSSGLVLMTIN